MKPELNIVKVEKCMDWLEGSATEFNSKQSIHWLVDQLGDLCNAMAFINGQMAVAKEMLYEKKAKAYESLAASGVANQQFFAPSLAKDYIASKCSEDQYNYDICERASRTIVHTVEAMRSALSALKMESQMIK